MKNPYFKLKTATLVILLLTIVFSCKKEESEGTTVMRVNFFKQPGYNKLLLSVQDEAILGSNNWYGLSTEIDGFNYEQGYIYTLLLDKVALPLVADGPSHSYKLKKIISKQKASADATFKIDLRYIPMFSTQYFSSVSGNVNSGFILANEVQIDCDNLCNALDQALKVSGPLSGTFKLNSNGSIKLVALN